MIHEGAARVAAVSRWSSEVFERYRGKLPPEVVGRVVLTVVRHLRHKADSILAEVTYDAINYLLFKYYPAQASEPMARQCALAKKVGKGKAIDFVRRETVKKKREVQLSRRPAPAAFVPLDPEILTTIREVAYWVASPGSKERAMFDYWLTELGEGRKRPSGRRLSKLVALEHSQGCLIWSRFLMKFRAALSSHGMRL